VIRTTGAKRRRLVRGYNATWSSDGKRLAFQSAFERAAIEVIGLSGRGHGMLTPREHNEEPIWSPVGGRILFTRALEEYEGHITVVNSDGSGLREITQRQSSRGVWSRDGHSIAFLGALSPQDLRRALYVIREDGSGERMLVQSSAQEVLGPLSWSRRGEISFELATARSERIAIISAEGGSPRVLTNGFGAEWSPNGRWLAFTDYSNCRGADGVVEAVYVIRRDGSHRRRVSPCN
jgi:Tol biopolymer transport system component